MTQTDVLRSRIEEQSQLICVLKQRNDQLLAKVNASETQNEKLIQGQGILRQQLKDDNKRFDRLEDHFNTLASNHQEMIQIKDQYKASNEHLRSENNKLQQKLHAKDSEKVSRLSREIRRLEEALRIETELLQQQQDQNMINQQSLKENTETLSRQEKEIQTKSTMIIKQEQMIQALRLEHKTKEITLADLKRELSAMVSSNMKRGEMLAKLQYEKAGVENELEKARKDINDLKLKWKNELEKIDVNYKIRALQDMLEEARGSVSELEMHKSKLKNELSAEKLLNSRLRQYK